MQYLGSMILYVLALASTVAAGSIKDVEHIVFFMQENRAFDHYFGTMAGVRGFKDPNVQVNSNGTHERPVWYQNVNASMSEATDYLLPFYLNHLGGHWEEATQCLEAGSNGWGANHAALDGGLNDDWATRNTPWSWGYFTRKELPNHFGIAEGWTIGDMYQQSVIASTNPNRVTWISGSINVPGSPQTPDQGGMYIDNNEVPGCEKPGLSCYPLKWITTPEIYEKAGVSWQVYQDTDNFDDNPLAWFKQFQKAKNGSTLANRGMAYIGLEKFYEDAAAGTLPQISYIIGPAELSEHPPYQPKDGAWLQQKVVDVVTSSPLYNNTVLIISYDETGGFGDHVVPYHSPRGTPGEWVQDPWGEFGYVYAGPGFRLPFYIISPWTRGGNVYVEHADHVSQIKFVEEVFAAKGIDVVTNQIPAWRRAHMADLTKAFDFENPDYSIPSMQNASYPSQDKHGLWNGYAVCESTWQIRRPPVPYGRQTESTSLVAEQGFKAVRGQLTEGRYLVFEMNGYALTSSNGRLTATKATAQHENQSQRFVIYENGSQYTIKCASDSMVVAGTGAMQRMSHDPSASFTITDMGNGKGHSVASSSGQYLTISSKGVVEMSQSQQGFQVYSVTYDD